MREGRRLAGRLAFGEAITRHFSPLTSECRNARRQYPARGIPRSRHCSGLSHQLGRLGLHESENATLLNAAIRDLARRDHRRSSNRRLAISGVAAPLDANERNGDARAFARGVSGVQGSSLRTNSWAVRPSNRMQDAMVGRCRSAASDHDVSASRGFRDPTFVDPAIAASAPPDAICCPRPRRRSPGRLRSHYNTLPSGSLERRSASRKRR